MSKVVITLMICFNCLLLFGQEHSCKIKRSGQENKIVDSVQFYSNFYTGINLKNEDCQFVLAEMYENVVPAESVNKLCVIFFESEKKIEGLNYKCLFDSKLNSDLQKKIRLIYVVDMQKQTNTIYQGATLKKAYKLKLWE